jgi:prephenate dehydrogenase
MVNQMEDGFQLQNSRIAIVGLGLMGGSLALALKGKCAALYGIDPDHATIELAIANRIVDEAAHDPAGILSKADLVILAVPVSEITGFIQKLSSFIRTPCIVFDLGSTKRDILNEMATLPENFEPIGGHPICGKEKLGLENADANLYREAPFVVSSLKRTTLRAKSVVQQIISSIGAKSIEMTAEEHDRILAATSHLPFLISSALTRSTPCDYAALLGPGFRSTSRLAGTPSHMMLGILKSNRDNVVSAVQRFRHSLDEIEIALRSENDSELASLLDQSRASYRLLTEN